MSLVEVRDLDFSYRSGAGRVKVLDGLSFSIQPGEMVAIQGPSGSGKSTLLYLLGGLLDYDQGDVFFEGRSLKSVGADDRARLRNERIGFVFQQFFLLARATVLENVLLPEKYAAVPRPEAARRKAEDLLKRVGLGDRLHHRPNEISGGQQQRVAIARALLNDASLILADEPTGNLDSKAAQGILDLLRELNRDGRTVVIITHDDHVARSCDRVLFMRDGKIERDERRSPSAAPQAAAREPARPEKPPGLFAGFRDFLATGWSSLARNRARTLLTMMGVSVGIAAVLSMLTIGRFARDKILDSYAELGVNTVMFNGYQNWRMSARDRSAVMFQEFGWERDLKPLMKIFPMVQAISPTVNAWAQDVSFGGRSVRDQINLLGVNEWADAISGRGLVAGRPISFANIEQKDPVCLIGVDVVKGLFTETNPLGQTLSMTLNEDVVSCKIIGVLAPKTSNSEWRKPNLQVVMPYTYLQAVISSYWMKRIEGAMIKVRAGTDIEKFSQALKSMFEQKYGKSGDFSVSSDSKLIDQMQKFLTLFTWLLGSIALVTLTVGGMGITNMMLVTVSERYREIGLRKALGATDRRIRAQFLGESLLICVFAGLFGLVAGFGFYEGALALAAKFSPKIAFEWWWDPTAFAVSSFSILAVGIVSGLLPAFKAEKLQVIEALRSE